MRFVLCLCSALIVVMQVTAQQSASLDSRVGDVLARINAKDLHKREAAFNDMMALIGEGQKQPTVTDRAATLSSFFKQHPEQADRIKLGLIQLLKADNVTFKAAHPERIRKTIRSTTRRLYALFLL